ncbi:type II toxin-antitoxin system RelE/ParE family toxin [Nitrospirillum amazonense]|uniref:type II toxin-antitoxin system RelE/ParE family toxin n=1 Tax=Nitrospirillum amazonense TaxID=28077 RepID=UPI002412402A|nr:type II toxin-antitoxin system RelE/ParE family toxin [Nitrospirillum amazonense]MDG3439334.1 type II toxin-antitoxin system RelE/ParE family toxin [Nitrospirillum amazonense]
MKVVLSGRARAGLRAIALYIARDNKDRAITFVRELERCALEIGRMPEAFPLLPTHEASGIRRRVFRDYLIFYRVQAGQVSIIHILHGAQDYDGILFSDE